MKELEQEFDELDLEAIMREFGSNSDDLPAEPVIQPEPEVEATPAEELAEEETSEEKPAEEFVEEEVPAEEPAEEEVPAEEPVEEEVPAEEPAEEEIPTEEPVEETSAEEPETEETQDGEVSSDEEATPMTRDTIRLDDLAEIVTEEVETVTADTIRMDAVTEFVTADTIRMEPITEETVEESGDQTEVEETEEPAEEENETPATMFAPLETSTPLVFRPKSRLRELKRDLIAGPEKRYYELSEVGVGKLQMAIFLCLVVIAVSGGAAAMYVADLVPDNRMRLMVFGQILAMLFGALLGSYQMIQGIVDLFHRRFSLNTLLAITFGACVADSVFCLQELRVPICACFTLEVAMSLWAEYHNRSTEMGMMDTMRKATRLDSVSKCPDFYAGKPGYLRGEGQVSDLMDHYRQTTGPEMIQNIYALLSLLISAGIAVLAGLMHGVSMGVQIFSTTLLVAVPASFFVAMSRPMALLERRFHRLGTVLCGWNGIKELSTKGNVPLRDADIFPVGSVKINGVKYYGERDPEKVVAYAAALMNANGGTLVPVFDQLLTNRNGVRYHAANLQHYNNGGVGGEIAGEPVLMGTLDFLKEMGVEIPEGVMVKQAVYVAIDGELSGLFAITYNRAKSVAMGLATLNGARRLRMVMLAEDFMLTGGFMKEKFGVNVRRLAYPEWEELLELREKKLSEDAPALALTTQEGLAPVAYAITGARALKSAWNLGLVIHIVGGFLGMLIMAALAIVGYTSLLSPVHVLLYQLVWMVPGLLVTLWTKVI